MTKKKIHTLQNTYKIPTEVHIMKHATAVSEEQYLMKSCKLV
jgi:hypothetical protein